MEPKLQINTVDWRRYWLVGRIHDFCMCVMMRRAMKMKAMLESQLKLYTILVTATAIHSSETWIFRKNHETRYRQQRWNFCVEWPDKRVQIINSMQSSKNVPRLNIKI